MHGLFRIILGIGNKGLISSNGTKVLIGRTIINSLLYNFKGHIFIEKIEIYIKHL